MSSTAICLPRWELVTSMIGDSNSVLDVGCRDRALAAHLSEETRYLGVDLFPPADVIASAEEPLPFDDSSFETVVFADVLEHLDDPHGALDEGMRVARRRVVVLLPNMYSAVHRARFVAGRTFGKYHFGAENRLDRHRWLLNYRQASAFVHGRGERSGWHVADEYAYVYPFRRLIPRAAYAVAKVIGGPDLWAFEYAATLEPAVAN